MPILINPNTNKPMEVDEKDLPAALQAGLTFKPGSTVQVVDNEDNLLAVPAEEVAPLFQQGVRLATSSDRSTAISNQQEDMRRQLAGENPMLAAGMSALSAGTFGVSDVIGKAVGGTEYSENRKLLAQENPIADVVGGVGGSLAAMPVSLAGLGAKTAAAASKALAPTILSKAATMPLIGKPVTAAAKAAIDAAAQGTLYGAGAGISEAALGNPEDVAENFLRGVGYGSLFGGIGGGGISLAGQALGKATSGIIKGTTGAVKAGISKAATFGMDETQAAGYKALTKSENLQDLLGGKVATEMKAAEQTAQMEINVIKKEIKDSLLKQEDPIKMQQGISYIQQDIEDTRKALGDLYGEGFARISTDLAPTGQSKELYGKVQEIQNKYLELGRPDIAAALDQAWTRSAGKATVNNAKDEISLLHKFRQELQIPTSDFRRITQRNFDQNDRTALVTALNDSTKNYGRTDEAYKGIREIFQVLDPMYGSTKELQKAINNAFMRKDKNTGQLVLSPTKIEQFTKGKAGREARADLERAYTKYLETPTTSKNTSDQIEGLFTKYTELAKTNAITKEVADEIDTIMKGSGTKLDRLIRVNEALGTGKGEKLKELLPDMEKIQQLRALASQDMKSDMIPTAIGVGLHGLGLPAAVSYPLTGAAIAAINPYKGLQLISTLNKVSTSGAKRGEDLLNRYTANIARRPQAIMAREKGREPAKWEEQKKQFEQFLDPVSVSEYTESLTQSLENQPEIRAAVQGQMTKGLMHLAETFPQPVIKPGDRLIPTNSEPPKAAQQAWLRRKAVLENPDFFLERIVNGEIPTKEEMETFTHVFPKYTTQLQTAVTKAIAESKTTIPVSKRLQLARIIGNSLDRQTDPEYNQDMQKMLYPQEEAKPKTGGAVGSGNMDKRIFSSTASEMDKLLSRE